MTSVLIVSDSHGLVDELSEIKARHAVDYYIHCGDSELDMDAGPLEDFYKVAGNCDTDSRYPIEEVIELNGLTFLIVHGHEHGVHQGLNKLSFRARELDVDIVCYGHTHVADVTKDEHQLYINPGSIRQARGNRREKTYAILEWESIEKIKVKYYTVDGKAYDPLFYETSL